MFIKKIEIQNFRLFKTGKEFLIDNLNVPDGNTEGSGLTLFVGENGCGKTSLLDAFTLPLLSYKAESFSLDDFFDPEKKACISVFSEKDFDFKSTMPKQKAYKGRGFVFDAATRKRENKKYLSSIIIKDQRYIRAEGETKPEDGKPDLRVSVDNPWIGSRFDENDILFLDKNRTYQIRAGVYNPTRFDRLMEDFNFQYIKQGKNPIDCNEKIQEISNNIENHFLKKAIDKFQEISKEKISLCHLNNWLPYSKAFLGVTKENKQHVSLGNLGSGYEMIFSLLYSFYLSQQSGKQLIVLLDEPELHLHPRLQEDFVKILLEFSKLAQIILTTHSPLFVKQVLCNNKAKINVLNNQDSEINTSEIGERRLPYLSANEINYIAFGLATEEYHNELYEELKSIHGVDQSYKDFDNSFFVDLKNEPKNSPWKGNSNSVSIHTFIRNQIHHQKDNGKTKYTELKQSIEKLRGFF